MNLTPDQKQELSQFPPALVALVEAELAAGNAIVEIGHSHPAPPVGAYLKLANRITTRRRVSGDGLSFYERQSSSHCGEFTDDRRFFFVLEAPPPPPEEPDMDAIRAALQPKPQALPEPTPAGPDAGAPGAAASRRSTQKPSKSPKPPKPPRPPKRPRTQPEPAPTEIVLAADQAVFVTETSDGIRQVLHFRDPRPPHRLQFAFERELMRLFTVTRENGRLTLRTRAHVNGVRFDFELLFLAALPTGNRYSLGIDASWADQPASSHEYFRSTTRSWLTMWTRDLVAANPPRADEGSDTGYQAQVDGAVLAQANLDSIAAVQQAILAGLRNGGAYRTSHREGGSNLAWQGGRFVRTDFGEQQGFSEYPDENAFLGMLRQFCAMDVTRHAGPEPLTELDAWKLVLRRMDSDSNATSDG